MSGFRYGGRLSTNQRFIHFQPFAREDDAIGDDLIARSDVDHVVQDNGSNRNVEHLTTADRSRSRRGHHRQSVQNSLGAKLLDDSDQSIGDQHATKQSILRGADNEDDAKQHSENSVEARKDVGPDDLQDRSTRPFRDRIG